MTIDCPHHDDCRAWTGDERRRDGDTYQWECSTGLIWWADRTGYWNDDEPTR